MTAAHLLHSLNQVVFWKPSYTVNNVYLFAESKLTCKELPQSLRWRYLLLCPGDISSRTLQSAGGTRQTGAHGRYIENRKH